MARATSCGGGVDGARVGAHQRWPPWGPLASSSTAQRNVAGQIRKLAQDNLASVLEPGVRLEVLGGAPANPDAHFVREAGSRQQDAPGQRLSEAAGVGNESAGCPNRPCNLADGRRIRPSGMRPSLHTSGQPQHDLEWQYPEANSNNGEQYGGANQQPALLWRELQKALKPGHELTGSWS